MITYGPAQNDYDLQQILDLQFENLKINLTKQEIIDQGFVTVQHDLELLREMNEVYPHITAKIGKKIIGYALVMLPGFSIQIPILANLFTKIRVLSYRCRPLVDSKYFVMGQICIAKPYRGKGIFNGLYREMKKQMQAHFQYVITEIASKNVRSLKAHAKVGFETIQKYTSEKGEDWEVVLWDWH